MNWEVRIMRSGISCFNATLFRKNLGRFWPLWGMASFIGVLFPLALVLQILRQPRYVVTKLDITGGYYSIAGQVAPVLCLIYAVLCAMAVWSYLYSARSVGMMHSLPIRREGIFLTNFLSGLAMMLIPFAVTGAVCVAVSLAVGAFDAGSLAVTVLLVLGNCLFYFASATFAAFLTGNLLALPAIYFLLHFLEVLLDYLVSSIATGFFVGVEDVYAGVLECLSPTVYLLRNIHVNYIREDVPVSVNGESFFSRELVDVALENGRLVGFYALAGVVLLILAYLLYRRRGSERAGDVMAAGWLRPVFQCVVTALAALGGGVILYELIWRGLQYGTFYEAVPMAVCLSVGGLIGYYAAAMLLKKTFRVFCSRFFLGLAGLAVVLTGGIAAMELDLTGFERWVPASSHVSAVVVNASGMLGSNLVFEDEEDIQAVLQVHQSIVDLRQEIQEQLEDNYTEFYLDLQYTMEDGRVVKRSYQVPSSTHPALVQLTQQVADFLNSPGSVAAAYSPLFQSEDPLRTIEINFYDLGEDYLFSGEDAQMLSQALKEDIQAGRIRVAYTGQSPTYYSILLTLEYADSSAPDAIQDLYLQPDAQSTLEALETLGLGESVDTSFSQSS